MKVNNVCSVIKRGLFERPLLLNSIQDNYLFGFCGWPAGSAGAAGLGAVSGPVFNFQTTRFE